MVESWKPENIKSYSYQHFEDNRPTQWSVTLGDIESWEVDQWNATDEFQVTRTVVDETGTSDIILFKGPAENFEFNSKSKELIMSGRGMEQYLARHYTNQHPDAVSGRLDYSLKTVGTIISDLLRGTEISVGSVDTVFTTATISQRFDFISILEAVSNLAESFGARFWVDEDYKLYFKESRGGTVDTVQFVSRVEDSTEDIKVSNKIVDYTDLINRLTVMGKGDGNYQLYETVEDVESQNTYGIRDGVETRRDIIDEDTLGSYGNKLLDIVSEPRESFTLETKFNFNVDVGDYVKVIDDNANIDGYYKVVSLSGFRDSGGRDDMSLELSNRAGRFEQAKLWARLRTLEKTARGASMIIPFIGICSNCSSVVIDVFVPRESEEAGVAWLNSGLLDYSMTSGSPSLYIDDTDRTTDATPAVTDGTQADVDILDFIDSYGFHEIKLISTATCDINAVVRLGFYSHSY